MFQDLFAVYFEYCGRKNQTFSCEAESGGLIDEMFKPPNGNSILIPFSINNRNYIFAARKSDDEKFEDILINDPKKLREYVMNFYEKKWEEKFWGIKNNK